MNTSQPQPNAPTEADLELLSAYLDNQLSVAERVGLEQRLRAEPLLRTELEELRATAGLLRNLEPVQPPRSFTLDPATAPRRVRFFPFAWVMQLGSGLAGMALVLLASVQLLAAPQMAPAMESAPAPMAAQGGEGGAAAMPAATEAPAEATMRDAAPESAPDASMSTAAENDAAPQQPVPPNAGGPPSIDNPAGSVPAAELESAVAEPYAAAPAEAADKMTPAPQPGLPPALTLAFGLALLAAAVGTFLYGRMQR
jgi:hypothetical protein